MDNVTTFIKQNSFWVGAVVNVLVWIAMITYVFAGVEKDVQRNSETISDVEILVERNAERLTDMEKLVAALPDIKDALGALDQTRQLKLETVIARWDGKLDNIETKLGNIDRRLQQIEENQ